MNPFRMSLLVFGLSALILMSQGEAQELGYRRVTMKERLKAFYRSGGKTHLGKKVHIHLDADVFRKKPEVITLPDGKIWHRFENQSVPVLVSPANSYYKRLQKQLAAERKKDGKRKGKNRIETVSLFARVVRPSFDIKGRCHLLLFKTRTYGGALTKTGG